MFVDSDVVVRVSGATFTHSFEERSKPAAIAVGGPFPNSPAVRAVVAGIGCLIVAMSAGLFTQFADISRSHASPAIRPTALHQVDEPLPAGPASAIVAARPLARH